MAQKSRARSPDFNVTGKRVPSPTHSSSDQREAEGEMDNVHIREDGPPPSMYLNKRFDMKENSPFAEKGDRFRDLVSALVQKPVAEMTPNSFSGSDNDNVVDYLENCEMVAQYNGWDLEKRVQALPLFLRSFARIFYNGLPARTKANWEELVVALKKQYNSKDKQWTTGSRLYSLRQEGPLADYIDELERLSHQMGVSEDTKLHLFINGLKPRLRNSLRLKQPRQYDAAVSFAKSKEATSEDTFQLEYKYIYLILFYMFTERKKSFTIKFFF